MLRPIIAIVAAAFIALAFTASEASARVGGGHGGFHGGFGGFRGGFHGFHGGFHRGFGFRRFGPGIGLGLGYGLGYSYYAGYPYYGYGGCVRPRRIWTPWGWRLRPVNVCRYYGYY